MVDLLCGQGGARGVKPQKVTGDWLINVRRVSVLSRRKSASGRGRREPKNRCHIASRGPWRHNIYVSPPTLTLPDRPSLGSASPQGRPRNPRTRPTPEREKSWGCPHRALGR